MLDIIHHQGKQSKAQHCLTPVRMKVKVAQSCPTLWTPWTVESMEFSRPEYQSGQLFPSPGDLPKLRIELRSPTLQVDSLPAEPQGKPKSIGVGNLSLLQLIFLTQESNQGLPHCRQIFYQLSYEGSSPVRMAIMKVARYKCW